MNVRKQPRWWPHPSKEEDKSATSAVREHARFAQAKVITIMGDDYAGASALPPSWVGERYRRGYQKTGHQGRRVGFQFDEGVHNCHILSEPADRAKLPIAASSLILHNYDHNVCTGELGKQTTCDILQHAVCDNPFFIFQQLIRICSNYTNLNKNLKFTLLQLIVSKIRTMILLFRSISRERARALQAFRDRLPCGPFADKKGIEYAVRPSLVI